MNKKRMQYLLLFLLLLAQLVMTVEAKDVNIALGKSYTLSPDPTYSQCTDKGDLVQLTDGKYIKGDTMWLSKGAVGWHLETPITITIDLDKVGPITGMLINIAAGAADVAWPKTIQVSVSIDGNKFKDIGELVKLSGGLPQTSGYAVHSFKINKMETEGRYVRFTMDPGGPYKYLFIDEIEIYSDSVTEAPKLILQSVPTENLIKNPGFEDWNEKLGNWEVYCNEPDSVSRSNDSYSGNYAVKISHKNNTSYSWIRQVLEVEPNTFYEGYITVRAENIKLSIGEGVNSGRALIADYPNGNAISQSAIVEGSTDWARRYIRFNTRDRTKIYFYVYLHKASGTLWVDDVFLTKSDTNNDFISEWRRQNRLLQDLKTVKLNIDELEKKQGTAATADLKVEMGSLENQINDYTFTEGFDYTQSPPYNDLHNSIYVLNGKVLNQLYPKEKFLLWTEGKWPPLNPLQLPKSTAKLCLREDLMLNEWGASAFNITNVTTKPLSVTVSLEGFSAESSNFPMENITVREVVFVESYTGRIQADALRKAKKVGDSSYVITVPAGSTAQVWLQINGKSFDKPGAYDGVISISSSIKTEKAYLTLNFWPISFPVETSLYTYNWSYLSNPVLKGREAEAVADLFAHYINTFVIHDPFLPWPILDKDGNILSMDFSKLDQQLDYHPNAKMYMFYLAFEWFAYKIHGGFANFNFMSPQWERAFEQWIRAMVTHLEERGISKEQFLFYPVDETTMKSPSYNGKLEYFLPIAKKIKEIDSDLKVFINPIGTLNLEGLAKISQVSDILCPDLQRMIDSVERDAFSNTGRDVWIYQPWGPAKDLSPIGYYRLQLWRNWQMDLGGSGFWNYAGDDAWDDFKGYRYSVIYGTEEELVPSKRWEAWREGIQDYEYLTMLEKEIEKINDDNNETVKEAKEFLEKTPTLVFKEAESNPELINEARKEILRLLKSLQNMSK